MKGSILQLLIFLLIFLFLLGGFCLFGYFQWFDSGFSPDMKTGTGFLQIIPSIIMRFFPLSIMMSVVFSFFTTIRMKVNRILSFMLIFFTATAVYFFGVLYISTTVENSGSCNAHPVVIYRGKINPFPGKSIFVGQMDSGKAYNVVVKEPDKLVYTNSMDHKKLEKLIRQNNGNSVVNPYFASILQLPGFMAAFSGDLDRFNSEIMKLHKKSDYYLLFFIISQILFASACWSLLRISRWPLINGFISLVLVRGFFAVYTLWTAEGISGSFPVISGGVISDNIFPILLSLASILVFLVDGVISGIKNSRRDAVK